MALALTLFYLLAMRAATAQLSIRDAAGTRGHQASLWSPTARRQSNVGNFVSVRLVTDVQYADVEDGFSAIGMPRHYRQSLNISVAASLAFEKELHSLAKMRHVFVLGDLIDRKTLRFQSGNPVEASQAARGDKWSALNSVLVSFGLDTSHISRQQWKRVPTGAAPKEESGALHFHFALGNHDLECFSRAVLVDTLGIRGK